MDLAIESGQDLPMGPVRDYLFIGEVNCRGESYLSEGDYDPTLISAEEEYLYESEFKLQEDRLRLEYPLFTAQIFDGYSLEDLSTLGVSWRRTRRQVTYQLAKEKEAFLSETANAG
jgi:hypothetical protein